ncbi:MAG TPA: hypothetical protein VF517_12295 [Thermoleophilaceae bacterium]
MNTGSGWATWNEGGTFVDNYVRESAAARVVPVFTYYMIRQSLPGRDDGDEPRAVLSNLRNASTMRAYLDNLRLFFERAARFPKTRIVLHVEPDMWGYGHQVAKNDDAASVPVAVVGDLGGLAREVVRLRDEIAPNVVLGWHVSGWGTGIDLQVNDPSTKQSSALGARAARFYRSLGARFDITFTDWSDRDAGFKERILGRTHADAWFTPGDYTRWRYFMSAYSRKTGQRIVVWQIPLGNTALDDSWGRYRDRHVQWLIGAGYGSRLKAMRSAGVSALLFGGGADGTTSAKTDGGYFRKRARTYYRTGPLRLP